MALNKYLRLLAVAVCVAVATVACKVSITMNGSVLDYNIYKTIRVSDFPIRTALVYPPLQQTFENTLLDYIAKNTRLQTTEGASDLELEGEITGYNLTPQAVTEDAYASMTRLTILTTARRTRTSTRASAPTATSPPPRCSPTCKTSCAKKLPKSS